MQIYPPHKYQRVIIYRRAFGFYPFGFYPLGFYPFGFYPFGFYSLGFAKFFEFIRPIGLEVGQIFTAAEAVNRLYAYTMH